MRDDDRFSWGGPGITLDFEYSGSAPVRLCSLRPAGEAPSGDGGGPSGAGVPAGADVPVDQPLVEVSAIGHGRFPGAFRHVDTVIGKRLRHLGHASSEADGVRRLEIVQGDPETGLRVTSVFLVRGAVAAVQTWSEAVVDGEGDLTLDFLSSFAAGSFLADTASTGPGPASAVVAAAEGADPDAARAASGTANDVDDFDLVFADNDWVAEGRWARRPLRELGLARIDRELQHHPPRSRCAVTNRGSWSTGEKLPTGVLVSRSRPFALCWQVEHNGPWGYELGETRTGAYLLLHGPTDQEHQWTRLVSAERPFASVPVSVGVTAGGVDTAFGVLTDQRRALRAVRPVERALPVVFNDYMNTLMGDPTTAKLLPLIDAAADAGADYFCIDAGWYAEGSWWDSVGAWQPAASRFPGGIREVIDHVTARGMVAGLWLEPEVIGVNSTFARTLPDDAFFSRGGIRVAEHGRHLLDLRSPAALAHLDEVVDRLVSDYGVGFFKMDYNTMTGPGTDSTGGSAGDGLLEHNRALLAWLDRIQARHPLLLIENCASGAMRMDYAMMSRLHLQSTSDQQDPVKYAPIAAAAPASLLPEQAGNWAYPQGGMSRELLGFSLVNAILGRMYLSGYLNRMLPLELELVREAVRAQKRLLPGLDRTRPLWPLGLPGWEDPWVALGLQEEDGPLYLSVWHRPGTAGTDAPAHPTGTGTEIALPLPTLRGRELVVDEFFPVGQPGWTWRWDAAAGILSASTTVPEPSARVLRLGIRPNSTTRPNDTTSRDAL